MDTGRRVWLEQLTATCERILESESPASVLHEDVVNLLARLRAELDEAG